MSTTRITTGMIQDATIQSGDLSNNLTLGGQTTVGGVTGSLPNVIELRNGANPQTLRVYNMWTDANNWDAFEIYWAAGQVSIRTNRAGTGQNRPMIFDSGANTFFLTSGSAVRLQVNAATKWGVEGTAGHWVPGQDNQMDIGWNSQRPRDVYVGRTLSIGSTATALTDRAIQIVSPALAGVWQYGIVAAPVYTSSATSGGESIYATFQTAASSFTMTNARIFHAVQPGLGAGSAVLNMTGLYVDNMGAAGVTNAYGIYVAAQSGASSVNVGLRNDATSALWGNVSIGMPDPPPSGYKLVITGATNDTSTYGLLVQNNAGGAMFSVRNDGWVMIAHSAGRLNFFGGGTGATKATITGSRGGNAALASLLTALANHTLIVDSTTA